MSLKLKLVQNNNDQTAAFGKYFPRVDYGKIIDIEGLAAHIHAHHAIYPEDLVEGVLKCASRCTRELMLEGYPVKWDGVAIFKAGLDNKGGFTNIKDAVLEEEGYYFDFEMGGDGCNVDRDGTGHHQLCG